MADYGYYRKARRRRNARSWATLGLKVLDTVMLVLSAACALLLVSAYFSKVVDPGKAAFFAFTGLMFPVLYVSGVLLMLYWIIRWKLYAVVMAVVLLAGVWNVKLFYRPDLRLEYSENKPRKNELVVMSYNVMALDPSYDSDYGSVQELIGRLALDNHVDILCLQEFPLSAEYAREFNTVLSEFRYRHIVPYFEGMHDIALAIYSRYPILDKGKLDAGRGEPTRSVWADVRLRRDTLRVINCHLQSTTISGDDVDYLKGDGDGSDGEERMKDIYRKLRDNYKKRAPQASAIASFAEGSPYETVLCADLNDTPVSYAYRKMSRGMQDSFVKEGRGTAGTYNGFFNMFRIDYIFMSKGLDVKNYYAFDKVYSDHNPVAASLEFVKK